MSEYIRVYPGQVLPTVSRQIAIAIIIRKNSTFCEIETRKKLLNEANGAFKILIGRQ